MRALFNFILSLKTVITYGVLGGVMLWVWNSKRVESSEKSPTVYNSVEDIEINGPKWIRVDNCTLDVLNSSFDVSANTSDVEELFIPVILSGEDNGSLYYFQTEDETFLNLFEQKRELVSNIRGKELDLQLAEEDAEYLKFLERSLVEMEEEIDSAVVKYVKFGYDNPPLKYSIEGILDPKFGLNDDEKKLLGAGGNVHVIEQGKPSMDSFYMKFLSFAGKVLLFLSFLSFLGLFSKEKK